MFSDVGFRYVPHNLKNDIICTSLLEMQLSAGCFENLTEINDSFFYHYQYNTFTIIANNKLSQKPIRTLITTNYNIWIRFELKT